MAQKKHDKRLAVTKEGGAVYEIWTQLIASCVKDSTKFWHLIAGRVKTYSSPLECNIPATIWGIYLQGLHGRENLQDAEIEPLPRWPPVSAAGEQTVN